jgi:hypothetical protein
MKTVITALVIGAATEAALVAALAGGGFGPCGPDSPVSAFARFLHTPGIWLMNALHIPESVGLCLVVAVYAAIWNAVSMLVLGGQRQRDR